MPLDAKYAQDTEAILSHRHDLGADFWTTPDRRLFKGGPFSALEAPTYLLELGIEPSHEAIQGAVNLFFDAWQPDGRYKVYPTGGILPCHTTNAVEFLCRMGYAGDERVQKTFAHLLETQYHDGGWRCNKFNYGRGPETECSNPFPSLVALNAFRYTGHANSEPRLDKTVDFLLGHWTIRKPIGPCHYGMGTLFMQVEYPFRGYNLFYYVYVLSFYTRAQKDPRFLEAFSALEAQLQNGQVVVQRVVPKLAKLSFCKKGEASAMATARYKEILANLATP